MLKTILILYVKKLFVQNDDLICVLSYLTNICIHYVYLIYNFILNKSVYHHLTTQITYIYIILKFYFYLTYIFYLTLCLLY